MQRIRGVVEIKGEQLEDQGDGEDDVAGTLWTCLRAKEDLRQEEFTLGEEARGTEGELPPLHFARIADLYSFTTQLTSPICFLLRGPWVF